MCPAAWEMGRSLGLKGRWGWVGLRWREATDVILMLVSKEI